MKTESLLRLRERPFLGRVAVRLLRRRGVDLPLAVAVGAGLQLAHGAVGLVVHESTRIGRDVRLYQGVTLGRSDVYLAEARAGGGILVGDRVVIGANAVVLFRSGETLTVADDAVIGAGSVVLRDVGPGEIWAGNPAACVGRRRDLAN